MYNRQLTTKLLEIRKNYPVIALVGPRQSGKSTLAQKVFADYPYVSLEDVDVRNFAIQDPRGFLAQYPAPVIIDEIQRAPDLLSYIQTAVDANPKSQYVITGSNHLLVIEKITQSLAGRVVLADLLPLSFAEIAQKKHSRNLEEVLFAGGYPKIHAQKLAPRLWLAQYYKTYVEKDVRQVLQVGDLDVFDRFVRLCAGRVGGLINFSSLANDCGLSPPTAEKWLSLLKSTYICFTLAPHFKNFSKRLIKTPKMYFYDTGLLCYLLRIEKPEQLQNHALRGAIFENWVISETLKRYHNNLEEPPLYFWRDQKGHEVDLVADHATHLELFEIKSAMTFDSHFVKSMQYVNELQNLPVSLQPQGTVIYAGDKDFTFQNFKVTRWSSYVGLK